MSDEELETAIGLCVAESGESEAKCASEINKYNEQMDDMETVNASNKEYLKKMGASYDSVLIIISTGASIVGSVASLVSQVRSPSNWISLIAASTAFIWYIIALQSYKKFVDEEMNKMSLEDLNKDLKTSHDDDQISFIDREIINLEEGKSKIDNFLWCFRVASGLSLLALIVAIWEVVWCVIKTIFTLGLAGGSCFAYAPKRNDHNHFQKRFYAFIKNIFPKELKAKSLENKLNEQKDEAQKTQRMRKISLNASAYSSTIMNILKILVVSSGGGWLFKEISKTLTKKATSNGTSKSLVGAKIIFYGLDSFNYLSAKGKYKKAKQVVDDRIFKLEELRAEFAEIDASSSSDSPSASNSESNSNNETVDLNINSEDNSPTPGTGECHNVDLAKGDVSEPIDCTTVVTKKFPKTPKSFGEGFGKLDKTGIVSDPKEYMDDLKRATTTSAGLDKRLYQGLAKKSLSALKKIMKLAKKKDANIYQDKKGKKTKPIYQRIMTAHVKNNKEIAEGLNKILSDPSINGDTLIASTKDPGGLKKKGRKVFDDKKSTFKMPKMDMGDELEDDTVSTTDDDEDYGELNEYEDLTKDINKNKGASLWKIIKVRYQKSAYDDLLELKKK